MLPYYLMRYEHSLEQIAGNNIRTAQLVEECVNLNARLANTVLGMGDRLLYEELVELIIRVSDHIMARYKALQGKVRNAMGGEVLELLNERAERLEREAHAEGIKQGIEQGIEQDIEQGEVDLIAQLKERGVDESLVAEALAAARASRKSASKGESA